MSKPLYLQRADKWRAAYNPLRGLTIQRAVTLLEMGALGRYANLMWAYRLIEKRNPTLRAVKRRRLSAISKLDWDIKVIDELPEGATQAQADAQALELRTCYEAITNLKAAIRFLCLAEFRGYAHLEKVYDAGGAVTSLQPVEQWHWLRDGYYGDWQYNPNATQELVGIPIDPEDFIIREVDDPIDEIGIICFIRQNLSQKDWDGFVEVYGIPPLFAKMPPNVPPEKAEEYQKMVEAVLSDFRGSHPDGAQIYTVDAAARGADPFRDHLKYQDELIVLAGTGGKLTMLAESGSGTLAGKAHKDTFDDIAQAEAVEISELMRQAFDADILAEKFPGQPALAYFEIAAEDNEDQGAFVERVSTLRSAGYATDIDQVSERTGLVLTPVAVSTPQSPADPLAKLLNRLLKVTKQPSAAPLDRAFAKDHAATLAMLDKLLAGPMTDADLRAFQNSGPKLFALAQAAGATTAELEKIFGTAAVNGMLAGAQSRGPDLKNRLRRAWKILTR